MRDLHNGTFNMNSFQTRQQTTGRLVTVNTALQLHSLFYTFTVTPEDIAQGLRVKK